MSQPHLYHQPNAPDGHSGDDSDSDVDLELQELGHQRSTSPGIDLSYRTSTERSSRFPALGSRIPLRNLRAGRTRTAAIYGDNRGGSATYPEDLQGLLQDEDTKQSSAGSLGAADGDPLLLSATQGRKWSKATTNTYPKFLSASRLWKAWSAPSPGFDASFDPEDEEAPEHDPASNRTVAVGLRQPTKFPPNAISNAKYTPWSFLPRTLYHEFSFFYNMYFLLVALSQIIPALRIGYLSTYIVPLTVVVSITLGKEALDDIGRRRRDAEANAEAYLVLKFEDNETVGGASANGDRASRGNRYGRFTRHKRHDRERDPHSATENTTGVREVVKTSRELRVGDVLKLGKDQRVPADVVLLKTFPSETATSNTEDAVPIAPGQEPSSLPGKNAGKGSTSLRHMTGNFSASTGGATQSLNNTSAGEAFIRTDQLDGETDWKLRLPSPLTQSLKTGNFTRLRITAGKPDKRVNDFFGTVELLPSSRGAEEAGVAEAGDRDGGVSTNDSSAATTTSPLTIDNTAWANTVLASSCSVLAVVLYTGSQTRQALSTSPSRSKTGLLELEINFLTKILCFITLALSFLLVALERFENADQRKWYVALMRFLILFSTIVPISMRVNLDMGKTVYAWFIERDSSIPGTVVRTSTIPEDLGRVEYLLSDKTGTLTQNGKLWLP